jgi:hypothetical protein
MPFIQGLGFQMQDVISRKVMDRQRRLVAITWQATLYVKNILKRLLNGRQVLMVCQLNSICHSINTMQVQCSYGTISVL